MKSLGQLLMLSSLIMLIAACGGDNKSGKSSNKNYCVGNVTCYTSNLTSPYNYGGHSVNTVIAQTPCLGSTGTQQRFQVSTRVNVPTIIAPNDIYVGVTTYGDVGVLVGNGTNMPNFVGYVCARSYMAGNGYLQQASQITIGSYSSCLFKPIASANFILNNQIPLQFRMLDYGHPASPTNTQFVRYSFCQ